jgi:hypothetical protein
MIFNTKIYLQDDLVLPISFHVLNIFIMSQELSWALGKGSKQAKHVFSLQTRVAKG